MIVEVSLRVMDDVGQPIMQADRREMYVHMAPDPERNLLGSLALLDVATAGAREAIDDQMKSLRAAKFQSTPEWRTPER